MYITPCISVCKTDPETRICRGCKRTVWEIRNWDRYTYEERMTIMRRLGYGQRRKHINKNNANSQIVGGDEDGN